MVVALCGGDGFPWRRMIENKHGNSWGGWCSDIGSGPYGGNLWNPPSISEDDRMIWSLFKNHSFFVNTYYKALRKRKKRGGGGG